MEPILTLSGVTKHFGGLKAVNDVSFDVREGEILSVIGPNGAGKSTLFKLIASFLKPTRGEVRFKGSRISGLAPHVVARKGVVRTFQETTIFKGMTVRETVIVAHHLRSQAGLLGFFLATPAARRDEDSFGRSADEILDFLGLLHVGHEIASGLPQGQLRSLGIAIGLAANPKILLLDEPFAGLNRDETRRAVDLIKTVRARGVTMLLVEHDVSAVMSLSDRIVVLNFGAKIAEGTPATVQKNEKVIEANNPQVIEAYLGVEDEAIGV